jgi:hypothetical protein
LGGAFEGFAVMIESTSIWLPLIYQYAVGGAVFVAGLVISFRAGAIDLRLRSDRFWLGATIGGLVVLFGVHLGWLLAAMFLWPAGW